MIVENLWKHLKRRDLSQFNRPRLDLVTQLVISNLLPRAQRTIALATGELRNGRAKALAPWQVDFKSQWIEMSRSDEQRHLEQELQVRKGNLKGKEKADRLQQIIDNSGRESGAYHTCVAKWTCSCPSYLLSRFLLCKHLVRLVNKELRDKPLTDLHFFARLQRNRRPPYYNIPEIHTDAAGSSDSKDEGEIDVLILGSPEVLARKRKRVVSEAAALLERQHGKVINARDSDEEVGEPSEETTFTYDSDPEHPRVSSSLSDSDKRQQCLKTNPKVSFSPARRRYLKECFEEIIDVAASQSGVHHKMAAILEDVLVKVEKVGGDIGKHKKKRKNPRT